MKRRTLSAYDRRPSMARFIVLSMLLHAILVLLFAHPGGGGSTNARALWGSMDVTIRGPLLESLAGARPDRERPSRPGAAPDESAAPAPVERPPEPARAVATPPAAATPAPPLLTAPSPDAPKVETPPPTPAPVVPEVPAVRAPLLEPVAPSRFRGELAPREPVEAVVVPEIAVSPLKPVAPSRVEPRLAPTVEIEAVKVPEVVTPALPKLAPSRVAPTLAPPVEVEAVSVPEVSVPAMPLVSPARALPSLPPPVAVQPIEVPVVPTPPLLERLPASRVEQGASLPAPVQVAPVTPGSSAPGSRSDREPWEAPDATPRFDMRRESAPPLPSGSGPRIDLDAARARAREFAREGGGRSPLGFPMPAPEKRKSKEELALEKAIKPECLKAYRELGLLAIAPMVWNAFGETACRW